jgi:hypothetical protein
MASIDKGCPSWDYFGTVRLVVTTAFVGALASRVTHNLEKCFRLERDFVLLGRVLPIYLRVRYLYSWLRALTH